MKRQQPGRPRTIAVAGAHGMVGRHLVEVLLARGDRVIALLRHPELHRFPPEVEVRSFQAGDPLAPVDEADVVVTLVGDPITASRWTPARKQELTRTRVLMTRSLVQGIRKAGARDAPSFLPRPSSMPAIPVIGRSMNLLLRGKGFWLFPMSSMVMRLVWGERAALFLGSHRMVPRVALSTGFQFRFPTLEMALVDLLGKSPLPLVQLMNQERENICLP